MTTTTATPPPNNKDDGHSDILPIPFIIQFMTKRQVPPPQHSGHNHGRTIPLFSSALFITPPTHSQSTITILFESYWENEDYEIVFIFPFFVCRKSEILKRQINANPYLNTHGIWLGLCLILPPTLPPSGSDLLHSNSLTNSLITCNWNYSQSCFLHQMMNFGRDIFLLIKYSTV